ncbi:hypothetical protein C1H46_040314 [Malus baccata]|uniref:Uncharacterized protein n=1 Tax=Malus baccata TaxID=106549 RepID=A0A540KIW1_MALBA|nr:hypothetical protein C1H46_040314 [Malus baccata]
MKNRASFFWFFCSWDRRACPPEEEKNEEEDPVEDKSKRKTRWTNRRGREIEEEDPVDKLKRKTRWTNEKNEARFFILQNSEVVDSESGGFEVAQIESDSKCLVDMFNGKTQLDVVIEGILFDVQWLKQQLRYN